jgi:regulatory protein
MDEGVITALEAQKRNKQRVNVYLDGDYAFSLNLDDALNLRKGQTLSAEEISELRDRDDVIRAVDSAARFLGHRPRSEHEVRRNLESKQIAPPVIELAVERLYALDYLDDRAFAAFWVRERTTFKPLSPRALRHELRQKGVPALIIDEALADLDTQDAAYRAAQSRLRRLRNLSRGEFQKKLSDFLGRRGFGFDEIRSVVRRVIDELDADDPDYFAADNDADIHWPDG